MDRRHERALDYCHTAFQQLVNEGDCSLYEAAFHMLAFAAVRVEHEMGRAAREQIIDNLISELDRHAEADPSLETLLRNGEIGTGVARVRRPGEIDTAALARNRDMIFSQMQRSLRQLRVHGIPDDEIPPALTDLVGFIALAMGRETLLMLVVDRLGEMLEDYMNHRPPFDTQR